MESEFQIEDTVRRILVEEFEVDESKLVPEAKLYEDLGLDSLDAVDLVLALEKAFGVKMSNEEEVRAVRTLQDLYQLIAKVAKDKLAK